MCQNARQYVTTRLHELLKLTTNKLPRPPLARDLPDTRQAELDQDAQAGEATHGERVPCSFWNEEHAIDN